MTNEVLRNVVGFKAIDLPPDIRLDGVDDRGYLSLTLQNRGGGLGEVTIFINGKEVIKDARDGTVQPDAAVAQRIHQRDGSTRCQR